ncbi:MAG TPA: hypothetical protein PK176_08420 [Acidobacteriota bacterium]|nr:hypothetical protein [Acidobacteriota bacterium]
MTNRSTCLYPMGMGIAVVLLGLALAAPAAGADLGTAFTYQGRLVVGGSPANGTYDFQFTLYDDASGGMALGTVDVGDITVAGGLFTVALDFGEAAITGQARWLAIGVRPGASTGAYTALSPLQELRPSPHALALPALWVEQNTTSPNLVGGHSGNGVGTGVKGATIGGGGDSSQLQIVQDDYGTIGGGRDNVASGTGSVIAGGSGNTTTGNHATVAGGNDNAADTVAFVGGGSDNAASGIYAVVTGGILNTASGDWSTISGGQSNQVNNNNDAVSGGLANVASGPEATIAGGKNNTATGTGTVIGGGSGNTANGAHAVVAGGASNDASTVSFIGGGSDNETSGMYDVIGGGILNTVSGDWSTIGGGLYNSAVGDSATVAGGTHNAAGGHYSFAAGSYAKANHTGSFVLADSTVSDFTSTRDNQMRLRFAGGILMSVNSGYWFQVYQTGSHLIDVSNGAYLTTGGAWTNGSRRASKENFGAVDAAAVLEQVAALPVLRWNYIAEDDAVQHIGPVAEDFRAAFGVGAGDGIATVDADGVALAAIQALNSRIKSLESENRALAARLAALEARDAFKTQGCATAAKGK